MESLEVSLPRANYARRKLGIKVHTSIAEVKETFDIFFSAHVLEHVPSVIEAITFGMSILKPAGLFVAFTPNGSAQFRRKDEKTWTQLWGMVHPNFLDDRYYKNTFAGKPILISSNPYQLDEVKLWSKGGSPSLPIDGVELLLLARK